MAVFSALRPLARQLAASGRRKMGGMAIHPMPSRWAYDRIKDDIHFYFFVAAIPLGIFHLYMSITVGEAKLTAIPEGYKPKEWEYYKNPISRLMVKYCKPWTLQQEYEMNLHGLWETIKVSEMVALKLEVQRQQAIHGDYKGWYHREDIARYTRIARQSDEMNVASRGSNPGACSESAVSTE